MLASLSETQWYFSSFLLSLFVYRWEMEIFLAFGVLPMAESSSDALLPIVWLLDSGYSSKKLQGPDVGLALREPVGWNHSVVAGSGTDLVV